MTNILKRIPTLIFILVTSCCLNSKPEGAALTIMSWNVQNLFNGIDDGHEYSEFNVANGEWSIELYETRLKLLSKIILLNNPDIIALQEIEGEIILEDLQKNFLPEYKHYVVTRDKSAIQSGFLSKYPIDRVGLINPNRSSYYLRSILEVTFNVDGRPITIFNNHWKSKSGGFSEHLRLESSIAIKRRLLELQNNEVVVLGDLNENYDEYKRINKSYDTALMLDVEGEGLFITGKKSIGENLYTVWADSEYEGSYIYKGEWESIDHFLLNKNLMDKDGFYFKSFRVDNRDELFTAKGEIRKWITDYRSGYSDHLPIILELDIWADIVKTTLE